MLEKIRVKMMTRIGSLREFLSTWKCNFSPMSLKVLEENISRSMDVPFNSMELLDLKLKKGFVNTIWILLGERLVVGCGN